MLAYAVYIEGYDGDSGQDYNEVDFDNIELEQQYVVKQIEIFE